MGDVIQGRFGDGTFEPALTKKQLAEHPAVRKSRRWLELRVREGMPSWLDGNRRMYGLTDVLAWMADHGFRGGGSAPRRP